MATSALLEIFYLHLVVAPRSGAYRQFLQTTLGSSSGMLRFITRLYYFLHSVHPGSTRLGFHYRSQPRHTICSMGFIPPVCFGDVIYFHLNSPQA